MKAMRTGLGAILLCIPLTLGAAEPFGPWNSDMPVGDARFQSHKTGHHHRIPAVSNGFQGGAYLLIRFFQEVISPQDGPNCRYSPVCSAYGRQAVERYGAFIGAIMAGDRLLRCNPYAPHGHDPLPESLGD